jgi:uncharacterized protein (TIGR03118 family)
MKCTLLAGLLVILSAPSLLLAQSGYSQTNLVANTAGVANNTDPQLSNPWGISFIPGQPFWIANNNGGTSTLYDAQGVKQSLVVGIPSASVSPCSPGCPTGTVANSNTSNFSGGAFLFDTEDGIIANWTGQANAIVAVDNSASGAVYKGLALLTNSNGTFLLAANFNSGHVDVFDHNFNPTALSGSFTDPKLPAGYAPHGIHIINNQIYVAYAQQDTAKHDPNIGAGLGVVDIFDTNGNFVSTFATGGTLNAPWGVVAASASFGTFSNDILVGNFGDGTINAFDTTGKSLGQVTDSSGHAITNPGLWDMVYGAGGTGDPNTLYFTAGGASQTSGLFATLVPASATTTAGFSLALSAKSVTVAQGGSSNLTISAAAVGGFNSQIALSCSTVSGLTCAFSPATIAPGSSTPSTLTISASSTPPPMGYRASLTGMGMTGLLPGLGVFGTLIIRRRKPLAKMGKRVLWTSILGLLVVCALFTVGCSGSSSHPSTPVSSQTTLMVTGTSGAITHSTPVTVTIK